jgi:excisionase family DNA binding protein
MSIEERLERIERLVVSAFVDVLSTRDVAYLLNLSESRVRHLVSEKKLPHYRSENGRVYFHKDEIQQWQLAHRVPTQKEINSMAVTHTVLHSSKINKSINATK